MIRSNLYRTHILMLEAEISGLDKIAFNSPTTTALSCCRTEGERCLEQSSQWDLIQGARQTAWSHQTALQGRGIFARSAYYVGACSPVMLNPMSVRPCVRPSVRASGFFVSFAMRHLTRRHHFWVLDKGDKNPVWHFGFFKKGPISWFSRWCEHSPGPVFEPFLMIF